MKHIATKIALVMTFVTSSALAASVWSTTSSAIDMVEVDNIGGTPASIAAVASIS